MGPHGWQHRDSGETPFLKVSSLLPGLHAKHSGGLIHTRCSLLFKENEDLAKSQQPAPPASTSSCPKRDVAAPGAERGHRFSSNDHNQHQSASSTWPHPPHPSAGPTTGGHRPRKAQPPGSSDGTAGGSVSSTPSGLRGAGTATLNWNRLSPRLKTHLEDSLIRTSRLSLTLIPRCSS